MKEWGEIAQKLRRLSPPLASLLHREARELFGGGCAALRLSAIRIFLLAQLKLTGSMSTARVTSSGSTSPATILASDWLRRLMARVRSMMW